MARINRVRTRRRPRPDTIDAEYDESVWTESLSWCSAHGVENLDCLPDYLTPSEGCPVCGSVFVDLVAVGYVAPELIASIFLPEDWMVALFPAPVRPSAVELVCFGGHRVEYNAHTRKLTYRRWYSPSGVVNVEYVGPAYALGIT